MTYIILQFFLQYQTTFCLGFLSVFGFFAVSILYFLNIFFIFSFTKMMRGFNYELVLIHAGDLYFVRSDVLEIGLFNKKLILSFRGDEDILWERYLRFDEMILRQIGNDLTYT